MMWEILDMPQMGETVTVRNSKAKNLNEIWQVVEAKEKGWEYFPIGETVLCGVKVTIGEKIKVKNKN